MSMSGPPPPDGDVNRGPAFLAVSLVTTAVGILAVCLRLYVRARITHNVSWDDLMIIIAIALVTASAGVNFPQVAAGYGRHQYYLTNDQIADSTKYTTLFDAISVLSTAFSKASVCLFFLRIIKDARARKRQWFLYGLMIWAFIYDIITICIILTLCRPIAKIWLPNTPGRCLPSTMEQDIGYFNGACSAFADFSLAFFPLTIVKPLQQDKRTKAALCCILGLSFFIGVTDIVRTYEIRAIANLGKASGDFTFTSVDLSIWALLEANLSVIVACVPPMRPLFSFMIKQVKLRKTAHNSRRGYRSAGDTGQAIQNGGLKLSDFSESKANREANNRSSKHAHDHWKPPATSSLEEEQASDIQRKDSDTGSEQNILAPRFGEFGIMKMTEVEITHDFDDGSFDEYGRRIQPSQSGARSFG